MTLESLPNDVAALRALLVWQGAELAAKHAELLELRQTIRHRELYIEKLKLQLARLRRLQFGRSSEKLEREIEQLELLIEELEMPSPAAVMTPPSEKLRPARRPLPEHLPREAVIHAPACSCPSCGGALRYAQSASRKNYLFAGADSGGERAAAIYSLVGTAKLNGIDEVSPRG